MLQNVFLVNAELFLKRWPVCVFDSFFCFLNIWLLMQYFLKDEMLFEAVLRETFYTWTPEIVCVKCLLKSTWRRVYTWYGWLIVIFPTEKNKIISWKKRCKKMCCYACTCMEWNSRNVGNVILCGIKIKIFISGQQCQWIINIIFFPFYY